MQSPQTPPPLWPGRPVRPVARTPAIVLKPSAPRAGAALSPAPHGTGQPPVPAHRIARAFQPSARPARGFTLVETAISGVVIAGVTAGLMLAVRYSQMVTQGRAVGEQLSTISEGAGRYMKQYARQILALDRACAEPTLQLGSSEQGTGPVGGEPDCKLVLDGTPVKNGFHPTVDELKLLQLLRADDGLLLPFSPGIVMDKRTGQAAVPRMAVWIRPVRQSSANPDGGTSPDQAVLLRTSARAVGTDPSLPDRLALNMPPTLFGVSCYNGGSKSDETRPLNHVFLEGPGSLKVRWDIDTPEKVMKALGENVPHHVNGESYCREVLKAHPELGFWGTSTTAPGGPDGVTPGNGSAGSSAWTLESVVFNTQPYYFGMNTLPMGAASQIGAALEHTGYAGRLSMPQQSAAKSLLLQGLYGRTELDNPVKSSDGQQGLPGVLAAVQLMADSEHVAGGGGGGGSGGGDLSWDAAGNNLVNAGLMQGRQIAGETAVVGTGISRPTGARDAVMAVNGNMVMGQDSVLMAHHMDVEGQMKSNHVKASLVEANRLLLTGRSLTLGERDKEYAVYVRNNAEFRFPRVKPGTPCGPFSDMAMTHAVSIQYIGGAALPTRRFVMQCTPDARSPEHTIHGPGTSHWSSPEYEAALAAYPTSKYRWVWFNYSPADDDDAPDERH